MSTRPFPAFVYKITDQAPPPIDDALPHALPLSTLDAQDGFIHLSNAAQVPITADLFFKEHRAIWLLRVDARAAAGEGELRWVAGAGLEGCVHLHGGRLGRGIVVGAREFARADGAPWKEALDDAWLADGPQTLN